MAAREPAVGGKKKLLPSLFLFLLLLLLFPFDAQAQLRRRGEVNQQDIFNPHPVGNEVLLPMPCGMSLSLAPVAVPVNGLLWDMETRFGCLDCDREDMGYYDRQYTGYLSAPFTLMDLPESWWSKMPESPTSHQYYFIGRYEITRGQWDAVMMNRCPEPDTDAARPAVNVSWYEALAFTESYMVWLLENAPDSLPSFLDDTKNVGTIRLPTEHEWEYAARGGHAVSASTLRIEPFFPMQEGTSHADYAVFRDGTAEASRQTERIGRRLPNPLGLYDIAGNVAEMTLDNFRFSIGGRLHGSSGGFVRKGGSFLTGPAEILPGRREEAALFLRDGPAKAFDLGFRVALSGINTPSGPRSRDLQEEWHAMGETGPAAAGISASQDPLAAVDALIKNARTDDERRAFETLRGLLKDANIEQERHNASMALTHVQAAVHAIYTLRNLEQRRVLTSTQISLMQSDLDRMAPEVRAEFGAPYLERLENWSQVLLSLDVALRDQFTNYRALLEKSIAFPAKTLETALTAADNDIKGEGLYAAEIRRCYNKYVEHLDLLRQGKSAGITLESLMH